MKPVPGHAPLRLPGLEGPDPNPTHSGSLLLPPPQMPFLPCLTSIYSYTKARSKNLPQAALPWSPKGL